VVPLQNANFVLKANTADTRVDAEMTLNADVTLWSALPHTHVRGKRWEVAAIYPDGRTEMILDVPKYDFNWQTDYVFKKPLVLPKGTKLKTSAWYDNSAANKSNPDPTEGRLLGRPDVGRDAVHRVHVQHQSGGPHRPPPGGRALRPFSFFAAAETQVHPKVGTFQPAGCHTQVRTALRVSSQRNDRLDLHGASGRNPAGRERYDK
jgi:hypothetical protein